MKKGGTYSNNFRSDERECSLRHDSPPGEETPFVSRNVVILNERTWMFPIAESDAVMVGTSS